MCNSIFSLNNNCTSSQVKDLSNSTLRIVSLLVQDLERIPSAQSYNLEIERALDYLRLALQCLRVKEQKDLERYWNIAHVPSGLGAGSD
jgi:DnaJ-domain-containing protein 1